MKTYAVVYLFSMLLSVIITPIVIRLGRKFALLDAIGIRKVHNRPVPRIGGVVIVLSALVLILAALFLNNGVGLAFRNVRLQVIALLATSIVMFITGLLDDIIGLRARTKLLVQILAAVVLCSCGIQISSFALGDWYTVEFGLLSWPITIFWIVGITNAVNLIDG
ncbi:MAG TPA: undecaprenyl/decaprenyl-phosphate alpha-N-acetylglucosaminyl 1-phosphate transferase, partial [Phycisphaerales bacterium]|nr:undecaprenyl/decaprenyl-phosphate alpha-N-acetylglucosaminyl 1-phosphate transferase [Phycisphaerales bacterium]